MLYLLDTNTVSHLIKSHPLATQRLLAVPMHTVCVSAITAGELAFGLAKRPQAVALKAAVDEVLAAHRARRLALDDFWIHCIDAGLCRQPLRPRSGTEPPPRLNRPGPTAPISAMNPRTRHG